MADKQSEIENTPIPKVSLFWCTVDNKGRFILINKYKCDPCFSQISEGGEWATPKIDHWDYWENTVELLSKPYQGTECYDWFRGRVHINLNENFAQVFIGDWGFIYNKNKKVKQSLKDVVIQTFNLQNILTKWSQDIHYSMKNPFDNEENTGFKDRDGINFEENDNCSIE